MANVKVVFHYEQVAKYFAQVKKNVGEITSHHRAYWDSISILGFKDVMDHFEKQQGSKGGWKRWSALYRNHMEKLGKGDNMILQDTGRLRQSTMMAFDSEQIKKGYLVFNPAQTQKGFPYAYAHDTGGPILPKRDFMWLSLRAQNQIAMVTASYMAKDK